MRCRRESGDKLRNLHTHPDHPRQHRDDPRQRPSRRGCEFVRLQPALRRLLLLVVYGFSAQSSALSFESAWQRPHSSRHVAGMWRGTGQGKCTGATRVPVRMRALAMLLEHEMWSADVLTVRVHASCGRPGEFDAVRRAAQGRVEFWAWGAGNGEK